MCFSSLWLTRLYSIDGTLSTFSPLAEETVGPAEEDVKIELPPIPEPEPEPEPESTEEEKAEGEGEDAEKAEEAKEE